MLKKIALSGKIGKGKFALVDDEDYERVSKHKWYANYKPSVKSYYAASGLTKNATLHRFIMNAPKGKWVDHINHDTLDNRKSNLRLCSPSENLINRKKFANKKSKYKGISLIHTKKWVAQIGYNNKHFYLGIFETPEQAALAYNEAAKKHHGEFALLNIIL